MVHFSAMSSKLWDLAVAMNEALFPLHLCLSGSVVVSTPVMLRKALEVNICLLTKAERVCLCVMCIQINPLPATESLSVPMALGEKYILIDNIGYISM